MKMFILLIMLAFAQCAGAVSIVVDFISSEINESVSSSGPVGYAWFEYDLTAIDGDVYIPNISGIDILTSGTYVSLIDVTIPNTNRYVSNENYERLWIVREGETIRFTPQIVFALKEDEIVRAELNKVLWSDNNQDIKTFQLLPPIQSRSVSITGTSIPEPSTTVMISFAFTMLFARRNR